MQTGSAWTTLTLVVLSLALAVGVPWAVSRGGLRTGTSPASVRRTARLVAIGIAAWLALTALLAGGGLLQNFDAFPPPMVRVFLPGLVLTALLAFSPAGRMLTQGHGWGLLIGFQAFRIPVELMLAGLHAEVLLPVQMTFHGRNFDVLTGLTAIVMAWLAARGSVGRGVILAWNVVGLGLLANIVGVAVLSMPGRLQVFTNPPANTIVFHFPYVWLPTVLVLAALLGHLLVFRKLWQERTAAVGAVGKGALA